MNLRDVHIHTHAWTSGEEALSYTFLSGLPCCFTQIFNPCSCSALLCCDSTGMANAFPFGRYSPNAIQVMPSRSEPLNDLNSLELLWGWKRPSVPMSVPTNICQSQRERPRVITTTQLQMITKSNTGQTFAHSPAPASASSPQPPLSWGPSGQEVFAEDNAQ